MKLSLEEKAALLEGQDSWKTLEIPQKGLRPLYMTDGPLGVRKKDFSRGSMLGMNQTVPSTAFPAPAALANSWDEELTETVASAIGRECRAMGVDILLAPALNIKRDPRCGRNFEYFSEDPLLTGKLAAAFCRGVEGQGAAACLKHFAMNNSENYRYMSNSLADERTQREIYFKGFETAVKEGHPRAVMCSYNLINGVRCSEDSKLINGILRDEWGFDGIVMTDWGATCDRVKGVKAGVDLDMPGGVKENRRNILRAVKTGKLALSKVDAAAERILKLVKSMTGRKPAKKMAELEENHNALAARAAERCAVLLENTGLLPLKGQEKLLVVGELFTDMRYQGAGSSDLMPLKLTTPREAFDAAGIQYDLGMEHVAEEYDAVLFFGGLTEEAESEGYDREHLRLPEDQVKALEVLAKAGKKPILVLFGGSPMELPEIEYGAVLFMNLPGQNGGEAVRRLVYGEAFPAGKLSESWVRRTEDIAFGTAFGREQNEYYRENIFVGYRFYHEVPEKLKYPFGHGLGYTAFDYGPMTVEQQGNEISVSFALTNCGEREGAEVVQLYAGRNENSAVFKAGKSLTGWKRVHLKPGETQRVTLTISAERLAYYHNGRQQWVLENGEYPLYLGASVQDIRSRGAVVICGQDSVEAPYDSEVVKAYRGIASENISDDVFAQTLPCALPEKTEPLPYTLETPIGEYKRTGWGRLVYRIMVFIMSLLYIPIALIRDRAEKKSEIRHLRFVMALIPHNSTRSIVQSGGGALQMNAARALTALANGHPMLALREMLSCPTRSRDL